MKHGLSPKWIKLMGSLLVIWAMIGCSASPTSAPTPLPGPTDTIRPTRTIAVPSATSTFSPSPTPQITLQATTAPSTGTPLPTPTAVESPPPPVDPFDLISQQSLLAFTEDLTTIQPYSGWRNSATEGEAEALDYVAGRLGEMAFLQELGLEIERQSFRVFMATELWETRLLLTVNGQQVEVPADGLRGPRDEIAQALRFDSDGALNDSARNPVVVSGPVALVRSVAEVRALKRSDVKDKIVFLDYAAIDRVTQGSIDQAASIAQDLLEERPAGLVLVTRFANQPGESHGTFVGDLSALNRVEAEPVPPTLYVRLEDLAPASIADWDDLAQIQAAQLTWDADVLAPAHSGNLVARIPGLDASQAVILGAHIDSPNTPGALDDGSGSVLLLEVARVLDLARVQPPLDLYLVWFGSEEIGLYGSAHFGATHQELLDRTLAMLQTDMLSRPLDGIDATLNLVTWSYTRQGDGRLTWPDYLAQTVSQRGIAVDPVDYLGIESDNSSFAGFDVPGANLIYMNGPQMEGAGGVHYASHVHDPYDTVELTREMIDTLEQMVRVALAAALNTGQETPALRVTPRPEGRAVFVASHTESLHMTPAALINLGMTLSWEGLDVDLIPYAQAVTAAALEDAQMVVVLPVQDYPSPDGDVALYDEAWSQDEVATLEAYVAGGGLLVLTNSTHRLKYFNKVLDANEDQDDVNALAGHFGVNYRNRALNANQAAAAGAHPLLESIRFLEMVSGNGVSFDLAEGQVLAQAGAEPVVGLVDYGDAGGQVLVLADLSLLGASNGHPANLAFWQNLARYARSR